MLERMPKWLICIPLTIQWLWLSLKYRSPTLPSAANPAITAGGLVGEGKLEYFYGMGPVASAFIARYCALSTSSIMSDKELLEAMTEEKISFPVIAKPNLGLCGYGVRLVVNLVQLQSYLTAFPPNEVVLLQQYLPQDGEAGIFYARDPVTDEGTIIGLALRYYPQVTGDGHRTIAELAAADPRADRFASSQHHESRIDARIPKAGEVVRLATIGSTRVGGIYRDGHAFITSELTAAIDAIARDMPTFHFGRFDVRFDSMQDLAAGKGFTIMEINGAGSEAIQAWDPDVRLLKGLQIIFAKQRLLFAIGDVWRRNGVQPIRLFALARLNLKQQKLIALYPRSN